MPPSTTPADVSEAACSLYNAEGPAAISHGTSGTCPVCRTGSLRKHSDFGMPGSVKHNLLMSCALYPSHSKLINIQNTRFQINPFYPKSRKLLKCTNWAVLVCTDHSAYQICFMGPQGQCMTYIQTTTVSLDCFAFDLKLTQTRGLI